MLWHVASEKDLALLGGRGTAGEEAGQAKASPAEAGEVILLPIGLIIINHSNQLLLLMAPSAQF
jgi:hypothetical protein